MIHEHTQIQNLLELAQILTLDEGGGNGSIARQ